MFSNCVDFNAGLHKIGKSGFCINYMPVNFTYPRRATQSTNGMVTRYMVMP